MRNTSFFIIIIVLFLTGCGSSAKIAEESTQSRQLDGWVAEKSFEITSDWAIPLMTNSLNRISNSGLLPPGSSANRISLNGNSNYLKFQYGEVAANLPFYGERQAGGGYNGRDGGITFEGTPENFSESKDEKTLRHTIRFKISNKTESFDVTLTLYPNLNSEIQINSTQRFPMRYTGRVKAAS